MWVYTRQRNEQDKRMLINLEQYASIHVSQLGNHWFVDAVSANDSSTLAALSSQQEADGLVSYLFESLSAGKEALDLNEYGTSPNKEASYKSDDGAGPQKRQ